MNILVTILIGLGVVILAAVILGFTFYRVADVDKVLIITGGKEPKFINLGGAQTGAGVGTGNVLIDTLSQIPTLFKSLDVQNNALNGCSMNEQLNSIVSAVAEPVKGLLAQNETTIVENVVE